MCSLTIECVLLQHVAHACAGDTPLDFILVLNVTGWSLPTPASDRRKETETETDTETGTGTVTGTKTDTGALTAREN